MKIGISLNGEGRGHLTRISAIAKKLAKNHHLIFWAPETRYSELKNIFPHYDINRIPAFELAMNDMNQIDFLKTGSCNFNNILGLPSMVSNIKKEMLFYKPDIIISDFEPLVPVSAKYLKIPVVQFNHPAVVLQNRSLSYDAVVARFIARMMCSTYDALIVSSFYNGDVGPILREEIKNASVKNDDFFIVYLRDKSRDTVINMLDSYGNIPYKVFPDKEEDFVSALSSCRGIITNGGHQLLSEAAFLRKPVFMLPFEKQFEQHLNAVMMEKAGKGVYAGYGNLESKLVQFLESADKKKNTDYSYDYFNFRDNTLEAVNLLEYNLELLERDKAS